MTASNLADLDSAALSRLVAKDEIRDLAGRYALAVDDHDIDAVLSMFTEDGVFAVAGTELCGREQIRPFYVSSINHVG